MLNAIKAERRFRRAALGIALLALLTNCGPGKANEEKFSLYIANKTYDELLSTLQAFSMRGGYHVTANTLNGATPATTARQVMVEGSGTRILIQSALAEQCKGREGRRDVEYSPKVFDVNAFSTSYFKSRGGLSRQVNELKGALVNAGFRVVSTSESCGLL